MPARLDAARTERNFAHSTEPKRRSWARILSHTLFGNVAALARHTGYSERMWQHFIEPHSSYESPFEEVVEATLALRKVGADDPDAPFAEAARQLGYALAAEVPILAWPDASISEQAVRVHKELSDATDAAIRAARSDDPEKFRIEYGEALRALYALGQMVLGTSERTA